MFVIPGIQGPGLMLWAPDLTRAQIRLLLAIAQHPHGTFREWAKVMGCVHGNLPCLLPVLERKGYIVRGEKASKRTVRLRKPLVWREVVDDGPGRTEPGVQQGLRRAAGRQVDNGESVSRLADG